MRIERYPGKMVIHLAEKLLEKYGNGAESLFDPYCGSGVILKTAKQCGIKRLAGMDINPIAHLLSDVQLNGFCPKLALSKFNFIVDCIKHDQLLFPIDWPNVSYWFSPATIRKFELIRGAAHGMNLYKTASGRAILLAVALAVRPCSRADQRSPKPFISKIAKAVRGGKHYDPIGETSKILRLLSEQYGRREKNRTELTCDNFLSFSITRGAGERFTHIMTSPPYINAQDYFRNWKLELYLLEGLVPFKVNDIRDSFIGTECGDLLTNVSSKIVKYNRRIVPFLAELEKSEKRLAAVVHRYLYDMCISVTNMHKLLSTKGTLVIVCGDNLVGNMRIETSSVIETITRSKGFKLIDKFADKITSRQLAPKRHGHRGLIKEEIVMAFERI